jgi:hypothetical protein
MNKFLLFLFLFNASALHSQVLFERSNSSIYNFLHRLSVKGIIEFNDELKPLSRIELAEKLLETDGKINVLTSVEMQEIEFYKKEFAPELNLLGFVDIADGLQLLSNETETGFRFLLYRNNNFFLNIDPILGLKLNRQFDEIQMHRWNGLQFYGYFKHNWGFSFYFRDNEEIGQRIDKVGDFSRLPGFNIIQYGSKSIEYSEVQGSITYSWHNGNLSLAKQHFEWGSGIGGNLIFSDKAPSFPHIKFEFSPADWIKFVYFHGWLHSALIDSSTIRKTLVSNRDSYSQREKYIAAHIVSIYPTEDLSVSLGESIVYSDKIEFAYFIPVLFFRVVDHYLDKDSSNTGDNAQLFFNTVYKNPELRAKVYATLFIDEFSITNLLKGTNLSAVGVTAGLSFVDPVIENSELNFEYSRLNPFVYMNSNDAQLFTSHKYQLGHWIGSNGDQIYLEYKQTFFRGLQLKIWGEHIRKGQKELPEQQYELPYPEFLYGDRLTMTNFGTSLHYEILRSLFGQINFSYSNISDEDPLRTPDHKLGKHTSLALSFGYGF